MTIGSVNYSLNILSLFIVVTVNDGSSKVDNVACECFECLLWRCLLVL